MSYIAAQIFEIPIDPLKLISFGIVLLLTWLVARILGSLITRGFKSANLKGVLQTKKVAGWLLWAIGILIGLEVLGLEVSILLVIVVLGGIAIITGVRDIFPNFIAHEIITTYTQFKIGDWIQIGDSFGKVADITWMNTILMTTDNETVYIPNSNIVRTNVINKTTPGGIRMAVQLNMSKDVDPKWLEETLLEIGSELSGELVHDANPEVRVLRIDNDMIRYALLLKIVNPAKGNLLASEVRKRVIEKMKLGKKKT